MIIAIIIIIIITSISIILVIINFMFIMVYALFRNKHTGMYAIQKMLLQKQKEILTGVDDLVARRHGSREQEPERFERDLELPHPRGERVLVGGGALVAVHL